MKPPLIQRSRRSAPYRTRERGVTMALVALSLVAIISMAALSIDLGTLYEAKAEAQRAADLAALAAARMISLEGITGDPIKGPSDSSWLDICGGPTSPASLAATTVAQQNFINGAAPSTVNVYYGNSGGVATATNCVNAGVGFEVNPIVQVYVQQATLPTFFSRVFALIPLGTFSNSGVSATATAEVFNSSGSGSIPSGMIPVQPRCVKPWIIPNVDPGNSSNQFVYPTSGTIVDAGVFQIGGLGNGVIGESFNLNADCTTGTANCAGSNMTNNPPQFNGPGGYLEYVPALVSGTPPTAVPSCSATTGYQPAIAGCDQSTVYACGTLNGAQVDLTENPIGTGQDSPTAAMCLINYPGQDSLNGYPFPTYPFQIQAGLDNPLVKTGVVNDNYAITASNSMVTLPIADLSAAITSNQSPVTVIGFLQVFINVVNPNGSMNVTVMNIAGCSNSAAGNNTVTGTSPVPIRLITTP